MSADKLKEVGGSGRAGLRAGLLVLLAVSAGCVTSTVAPDRLRIATSEKVDCPATGLTIDQRRDRDLGFGVFVPDFYRAVGCDREWLCGFHTAPTNAYVCEESGRSREETMRQIVLDRLALETSCPRAKIEVLSKTEWRVGTETAYRLSACDRAFVCTTAAGRVDCKAALGQ